MDMLNALRAQTCRTELTAWGHPSTVRSTSRRARPKEAARDGGSDLLRELKARQMAPEQTHAWRLVDELSQLRAKRARRASDPMLTCTQMGQAMKKAREKMSIDPMLTCTQMGQAMQKIHVGSPSAVTDSLLSLYEAHIMGDMEEIDIGPPMMRSASEEEDDM